MNEIEKLHSLLSHYKTAMLVTHANDGALRARPMAIAQVEPGCRTWFLTSAESAKVHEIQEQTHVLVVCQSDRGSYLSLSGVAKLGRDVEKVRELWQEAFQVWFPGGPEDPDIVLIEVQPKEGEFWDEEGFNRIKYLLQAAKAYASGERPEIEEGEQHGRVNLP